MDAGGAPRACAYTMTDAWMTMIFRHAFFHGDPHPANILHLDDGRLGLVDFGLAGRLDRHRHGAPHAALRRRGDREHRRASAPAAGARRPLPARPRGRAARPHRGAVLPLLRRAPRGHRPDRGDPRGPRADLRDESPPPDPVRDPRQGDRDARLGCRRGLPGVQRLRGGSSLRATARGRAAVAEAHGAPRAARGCRSSARSRSTSHGRCTTSSTSCATASS